MKISKAGRRLLWLGGVVLLVAGLGSCAQVRYLTQAAGGQIDLLRRARPIADVLADAATPPETRRKLELVGRVRTFALSELGLPDHGAFLKYVDVRRPYVVWNVFAAPPDSVALDTSCFPIAGCVGYRGYFAEPGAQTYAEGRRAAGRDVSVGGVSAYSTLGILKDPVLSTMLAYSDTTLIRTIIHELSHPALYVKDDTVFNESFAVSLENEGMKRYLAKYGTPELREADKLAQERAAGFEALLLQTRGELADLYDQKLPSATTQQRKTAILSSLNQRYATLKVSWDGYSGYDGWFERGVNNASLGAVAAYAAMVPDFAALLARNNGSIPAFIEAAAACAKRPSEERKACLEGG